MPYLVLVVEARDEGRQRTGLLTEAVLAHAESVGGTTMGGGERGGRGAYRAEAPFSEPRQRSGAVTGACQGTSLKEAKEEAGDEGQSCPQ